MTSQAPGPPGGPPGICKRPGCGRPLPAPGLGRTRQFCSQDCARGYHNAARYATDGNPPVPPGAAASGDDPLAALETLTRQAAPLIGRARAEAARLDPARVRVVLAEAEAARQRAEARAVTAAAQAAEAAQEAQAAAEALEAARSAQHAAEQAADTAAAAARAAEAGARAAREEITAASVQAAGRVTAAEHAATQYQHERDTAIEAARQAQHRASIEISRARQAEADARAETEHVRADAARERDTFREHYQAQMRAADTLTASQRARADRAERQLDTELAGFRALTTKLSQQQGTTEPPGSHGDQAPPARRARARAASPRP